LAARRYVDDNGGLTDTVLAVGGTLNDCSSGDLLSAYRNPD
jgi:hypothetical protein